MSGTNNFKVFNENFSNAFSDAQYAADAQRTSGVVPGVAPSALHNKLYRQVSVMTAALGQVIANRGYNAGDADLAALIAALNSAFSPFASVADTTYYVSKTGSDSNDGSVGLPFLTWAKVASMVPQVMNHNYTINVGAGIYLEDAVFKGLEGSGILTIQGDTVASDSRIVNTLSFMRVKVPVVVNGIKVQKAGTDGFVCSYSDIIIFDKCKSDVATSGAGFLFVGSKGMITNSIVSNRTGGAITANSISHVYTDANSGTGNTIGLQATGGSIIRKGGGTQPAATTPESQLSGGTIS